MEHGLPVVGIGASAGGLRAMTELLGQLPQDTGMAFVLVQHLAPDHESMMPDILRRETGLRVSEAEDGAQVEPNHLYVIPPNSNIGILGGALQLMPRAEGAGYLPIDYFFHSLAKDRAGSAIGVVLSGTASDGTLGLKAIKEEGGITFAQEPETAEYDAMPANAIAAEAVDFVLSPGDIAHELALLARRPELLSPQVADASQPESATEGQLLKIFMLLRNRTGHDFTYYKRSTLRRRIRRRIVANKIERLSDYVRFLNAHPAEVDALFQDLLISVTGFFREGEAFHALKDIVFPDILSRVAVEDSIRIWVPGCATGEEAYSIVITLLEYLGDQAATRTIQVFGTDIDGHAIRKARAGVYPESIVASVSEGQLRRFFTKVSGGYRIAKHVRRMCVFATQDVLQEPPFSHQDLIVCRNLLIYLNEDLQRKLLHTLHYALNPGGYLLLGGSESVGRSADLFNVVDKDHKIYRKKEAAARLPRERVAGRPPMPVAVEDAAAQPSGARTRTSIHRMAESLLLNQYSPPAVLVDRNLDALEFIGHANPYLSPPPGTATLNVLSLAHTDLTVPLRVAAQEAAEDHERAHTHRARMRYNGKILELEINVVRVPEREAREPHYLVVFRKLSERSLDAAGEGAAAEADPGTSGEVADRIRKLEDELEAHKTYTQRLIADYEESKEELQAANEELQSSNEELRSTNEELETAREELRSSNEELTTVNEELENRNAELARSNDDLNNLIASADLPMVMLDESLRIRYFSRQTPRLLNLRDSDVGRPIADIRTKGDIGHVGDQAREAMNSLQPLVRDVQDHEGRWYSMRIKPYRSDADRIGGAIVLFVDITEAKRGAERARRLATVVEDSNDAVTAQDLDGNITAWNSKATELYGYTENEAVGANISMLVPEDHRLQWQQKVEAIAKGKLVRPFETQRLSKHRERLNVLVTMSALTDADGRPAGVASTERLLDA